MTIVRVFVPTYGRPQLLRRALASLCAQTLAEWVAEVHNDLPGDPTPAQIVAEVADPRITLVEHRENLGGTATFNLFFRPSSEPYYSILEDDNWWEPEFLERMLGIWTRTKTWSLPGAINYYLGHRASAAVCFSSV